MINYSYRNKIETDINGTLIQPFIVLCTRSGKTIGVIQNIQSLKMNHPMGDTAEISFDVYKYVNGIKEPCWDSIKNFKFILLPTIKDNKYKWYEITVNIDETNDTIKHITGIHANEAELGQLMLYEVEINTEADIDRDDYETITIGDKEYGTVFYCPEHPKNSLLHRILSDKASYYQIIHVDDTLKNIQREFSFNGISIVDAMRQNIAQEIQCLFVFGENLSIGETNEYQRTISVYDLLDYCEDCGERGTYSNGKCTHCGSTNIKSGYGEDSGIFITTENLTDSISFTSATDQVKNFFRLSAGDEDMTAAIRNCNPNGSQYLTYFSDEMKEDMSDELVAKINEYNTIYDSYLKTESITLPPSHINDYNLLIDKYQDYSKDELIYLTSNVQGFNMLTNYDYNSVNFRDFLQTTMMPASTQVEDTTAQEQIENLTLENMSPIGVEDTSRMSLTSSDTAVKDYAKVYVDTALYKIDVSNSSYSNNTWTGTITVTSYVDEEDTANVILNIVFNDDGATFTRQKIEKAMAQYKVQDIGDVSFLNKDISEVKEGLKRYSLDALSLLDDICSAVMDISAQAGYGDKSSRLYADFYAPYVAKKQAIIDEEVLREAEIKKIDIVIQDIADTRKNIIDYLNMESFFGDLYPELMLYRRETEYSNSNFISDGLTDSEIIAQAQEFFKRAQEELIKASTVQHSISGDLYNLFLIPEFRRIVSEDSLVNINDINNSMVKAFLRKFESGNWLRIRVDDKIYKLRMTNWEIDYDSPEKLQIEFSDVVYGNETMSDITSLLSQARSMASSYNTVMRQASKGNDANTSIKKTQKQGLMLSQNKIIDDINEQSFVINKNGALMRSKNDFDDGYGDEQVKILNKGIYYTNDSWETVKAGLGHFMYYDPINKEVKEDYGIIASTIVGQLLIGNDLKIYSDSGTLEMDEKGFAVTTKPNEDNTDLFVIRKDTGEKDDNDNPIYEKYIHVDSNGNLVISGNSIVIGSKTVAEAIDDARKVASNYLSADDSGIMVANLTNGVVNPSDMQNGKNVLITSDDVKVRDGQQQLASYGETTVIGKIGTDSSDYGSNIRITKNSISGNRRGVIGYDSGKVINGNIQTFNINIGSGEKIKEQTNPVYKTTGDIVLCRLTPSYTPQAGEPFEVYAMIYLNNGQEITTSSCVFNIDSSQTSELFEWDIQVDTEQYITIDMSYNIDDTNEILLSTNDSGCTDIEYKVEHIIGVVIFNGGIIEYPNFRFGSYDGTMQDSEMGRYSFNIGENNEMIGDYSFAQGKNNTAYGSYSHALGLDNYAKGDYSSVSGVGNSAEYDNQTVIGTYATLTRWDDLFVVGNGTDDSNRSNAMVLKDNGDVEFSGAVGGGLTFASKQEMITKMSYLKGQVAYSFFAQSSWTSFAINTTSTASSFGTICKMNSDVWYINFTSNETVYMAKYNVTNDTLSTKQLAFVTS